MLMNIWNASFRNSHTPSQWCYIRFWMSISDNPSEKLHCGNVVNVPYKIWGWIDLNSHSLFLELFLWNASSAWPVKHATQVLLGLPGEVSTMLAIKGCYNNLSGCGTALCSEQYNAKPSSHILQFVPIEAWGPGYSQLSKMINVMEICVFTTQTN